ncbi:hypothetical protein Hanom_Chr06g00476841 [Helianthus anomalus]
MLPSDHIYFKSRIRFALISILYDSYTLIIFKFPIQAAYFTISNVYEFRLSSFCGVIVNLESVPLATQWTVAQSSNRHRHRDPKTQVFR